MNNPLKITVYTIAIIVVSVCTTVVALPYFTENNARNSLQISQIERENIGSNDLGNGSLISKNLQERAFTIPEPEKFTGFKSVDSQIFYDETTSGKKVISKLESPIKVTDQKSCDQFKEATCSLYVKFTDFNGKEYFVGYNKSNPAESSFTFVFFTEEKPGVYTFADSVASDKGLYFPGNGFIYRKNSLYEYGTLTTKYAIDDTPNNLNRFVDITSDLKYLGLKTHVATIHPVELFSAPIKSKSQRRIATLEQGTEVEIIASLESSSLDDFRTKQFLVKTPSGLLGWFTDSVSIPDCTMEKNTKNSNAYPFADLCFNGV